MTRSERNRLFGRLTTAQQQQAVADAHTLADRHQVAAAIYVGVRPDRVLFCVCLAGTVLTDAEPVWTLVRVLKPRVNPDIQSVYRSETRRRSAPWEGRGHRD